MDVLQGYLDAGQVSLCWDLAKGYGQHYIPVEFKPQEPGNNYFATIMIKKTGPASQDFVMKGIMA